MGCWNAVNLLPHLCELGDGCELRSASRFAFVALTRSEYRAPRAGQNRPYATSRYTSIARGTGIEVSCLQDHMRTHRIRADIASEERLYLIFRLMAHTAS